MKIKPLILRAKDKDISYKASAGGVVSKIIYYTLKKGIANTSISFKFNNKNLYIPKLIYSPEEYEIVGSIYHDINIYKFLKQNIDSIKPPIILTLLPCQVYPVRKLLEKYNIDSIILSLFCSAQLSKDATYFLLNMHNINIDDVQLIRYRGNGWPSGVFIKTSKDEYFFHNNNSIWMDIFHSNIFTLKKCFRCEDTFGVYADIAIGDPWLKEYVKNDNIGHSFVIPLSLKGYTLLQNIIENDELVVKEYREFSDLIRSQLGTIKKKIVNKKFYSIIYHFNNIFKKHYYKNFIFKYLHKYHRLFLQKTYGILYRILHLRLKVGNKE